MKTTFEIRYACHPRDAKNYDTDRLREEFLIPGLMQEDKINMVYSHFDRMMVGGIVPKSKNIELPAFEYQKTAFFSDRRELGVINVGGAGKVKVDGQDYPLDTRDALYIGKGQREIMFESNSSSAPARFYLNAALAHKKFPDKLVKKSEANPVHLGTDENANKRSLNQYIVPGIVDTCQLMMGITDVYQGSVWNTMPCHLHPLRMEVYFYFDIPDKQAVCHLMGEPRENRVLWLHNEQAVISPDWSLHSASGTANYSFIWGMSGSDSEMDPVPITEMR